MPSTTKSQATLFTMVKAVQHGHLQEMPEGMQGKLKKMAARMSPQQVADMMTRKKKGA